MQCHLLEETKILLAQEIGDLTKQKAKLESQEQRDALMPGQCFVSIPEIVEQEDSFKKIITFYVIKVEQRELNTGWTVKRRYSDFDALHQKLKETFVIVNDFDLPGKTLGLNWSKNKSDLKIARLKALEKYLQVISSNERLVENRDIGKSEHVRNFLASTYKPARKNKFRTPLELGNEITTRTQQKLKSLSQISQKKAKEPLSKMMSFLDKKNILKSQNEFSDDEGETKILPLSPVRNLLSSDESLDMSQPGSDPDHSEDEETHLYTKTFSSSLLHSLIQLTRQLFDFKEPHTWLQENTGGIV